MLDLFTDRVYVLDLAGRCGAGACTEVQSARVKWRYVHDKEYLMVADY
jgi:hypothetical protein